MDIILESQEKVKEQVIQNTNDISSLKSNIKWIYQYGGVGGSGNGPGKTSDSWSLYVTINKHILSQDTIGETELILNSEEDSIKNLTIQIKKPEGGNYYIESLNYFNGIENYDLASRLGNRRLLTAGNYTFTQQNINIQGNGSFSIKVRNNDDPDDFHTINYKCITNPLSIDLNYVVKINNTYSKVTTIDVSQLRNTDGLYVELKYTFYTQTGHLYSQIINSSLGVINADEYFSKKLLEEKTKSIYFKLSVDYNDLSNLGYHIFSMNLYIDEGDDETIEHKDISCTIIPNAKYLQVVPSNSTQLIYNNQQEISDHLYTFISGIHGFNLTAYSGSSEITSNKFDISCIKRKHSRNEDGSYNIDLPTKSDFVSNTTNELIQENNILISDISINIPERITNTHQINLVLDQQDDGINLITLSFIIKYNNEYSEIEHFYIYVIQSKTAINWYKDDVYQLPFDKYALNYYRNGVCSGNFNKYPFINSSFLQFRKSDYEKTLTMLSNSISPDNIVIHIGIQYSDINNDEDKILTIKENDANNIVLYQNKIEIGTNSTTIYIPKEENYIPSTQSKYHLISILKHKLYENIYTITIYIDGVIENSIDKIYDDTNSKFSFKEIVTHKSNFSINLFEISYINDLVFTDNDISRYWCAYFDQFIKNDTQDENIIEAINSCKNITEYIDNLEYIEGNLISVKNTSTSPAFTTIENIALNTDTPVILIDYNYKVAGQYDNFINWFTRRYGENEKPETRPVSIYYSSGKKGLGDKISIPTNTEFYIVPQGSSTLNYSSKNLNIGIRNTSGRPTTPVFTPNFNINDTNTFLPESKFTLKTDIVDSSHSNNTSIGKFVNTNTVKFTKAREQDKNSIYVNHIKNCLLGFPVLLFIRVRINAPENDEQPDVLENFKFYYLGIYNFNLGRDSYFNMGYYPLLYNNEEIFDDTLKTNNGAFSIFDINSNSIEYKDGLIITEIQSGDPYFDFSQYHESILFQGNTNNKKYMFGDNVPEIYNLNEESIQADGTLVPTDTGSKNKEILTNLVKNISITGGLLFKKLGKNFGPQKDKYNASVNNSDRIFDSINQVPDFTKQWQYNFNNDRETSSINPYTLYDIGTNEMSSMFNDNPIGHLNALIKYESTDENDTTVYTPWVDYRSLVEYYVICMVFGLVDSVQKNLNLKSWNAYNANDPATFYTAFYDMDTCLGRDNGGAEVKYFAFSDYWSSSIKNGKLSEIIIHRDFYPSSTSESVVPIGYDIPSSYLFAIAKYARMSLDNTTYNNTKYPSPNMIYAMWRSSQLGDYGRGSLQNAKYFVENYFDTLKNIPQSLINYNYRFKYLRIENNNGSYSFTTLDKKPFHGRGKYSVIEWLSNRLRLLDAYFNLAKVNTIVQKYDIQEDKWSIVLNDETNPNSNYLSLNEFNDGSDLYSPDNNNEDIYILSDIFGKASKLNRDINLVIQSKKWAPIVITSPTSNQQYLVPEDNKDFTITVKMTGNNQLTLGGSQYWTYINNIGAFVEDVGINVNSKYLTNINLAYAIDNIVTNWVFNTPMVTDITLNNPKYGGTLSNRVNGVDRLLNLSNVSLANSSVSLDFVNNGFTTLDISGTIASKGIIISSCENFKTLTYNSSTNILKLDISSIWEENINLSNFKCKQISIGSNENFANPSIVIDNITNLEELNLIGNFTDITISNCQQIKKLVLPLTVKSLKLINLSFVELTEDTLNSANNITYNNEVIDISYLTNLEEISFENSLGFRKVILPQEKEIKLLSKAFANTNLEYIDFGDVSNGTLILCDDGNDDCGIFYNSRFTLKSGDENLPITKLNFKVQEKNTSLANLFKVDPRNENAIHNGEPLIDYISASNFIKNLGNKEYVTSFNRAFVNQKNINGYYKNGKYTLSSSNENEIITNRISFAGYNRLKSIECMFEGTNIRFVDDKMFENIGISSTINIMNFIDYKSIENIHINAFNPIKGYITKFLFDGKNDYSAETRKAQKINIYGYNQDDYLNGVKVHDLMFSNSINTNITEICGFNIINDDSDYSNLFVQSELVNINPESEYIIHDVFTNLNQFTNEDKIIGYTRAHGLNEIGLTNLPANLVLYNAFISNLNSYPLNKLKEEDLIDISKFISFSIDKNQFAYIQETTPENYKNNSSYNTFDFYKKIYTYNLEDETVSGWGVLWEAMNIPDVSNLFNKCIIYANDENYILNIPGNLTNVKKAQRLFSNTTIKYKNGSNETNIGIKLDENSLKAFSNLENGSYMFSEAILNGNNSYPFVGTGEIFKYNTKLANLRYMFSKSSIIGNHKTYIEKNDSEEIINGLNTYYKRVLNYEEEINNIRYYSAKNYLLDSIEYYTGDSIRDAAITTAYSFIPSKLFANINEVNLQLTGMFENSDFEGYLPIKMFENKTISSLTNFIKNCKILPQQIEGQTNKYVFINKDFVKNATIIDSSFDIFNFYILCGDTSHQIYCILNDSFDSATAFTNFRGFNLQMPVANNSFHLIKYVGKLPDSDFNSIIQVNNKDLHINLCYNTITENEGISMDFINTYITPGSILCNEYLSTILNGYLLVPKTIITEYPYIKFMKCGIEVINGVDHEPVQISRNIKLPIIEYYNSNDLSNLINDEVTEKFTSYYYTYNSLRNNYCEEEKILFINNSQDIIKIMTTMFDNQHEEYQNNENLKNIYYNYLIISNTWYKEIPPKPVNYDINSGLKKYSFKFRAYNKLKIYNENQEEVIIQYSDDIKLNATDYTFYSKEAFTENTGSIMLNEIMYGYYSTQK